MQVSGTESEVCKDIEARQRLGINKYGRTVAEQDYKLVEWLEHAYHEALDQAIYLKRSIEEIKATEVSQAEVVRPKAEPGAAACSSAVVRESLPRSADRDTIAKTVADIKIHVAALRPYFYHNERTEPHYYAIFHLLDTLDLGQVAKSLPTESTEKQT